MRDGKRVSAVTLRSPAFAAFASRTRSLAHRVPAYPLTRADLRLPAIALAAILALGALVAGQQRPDFSGTWVLISPSSQVGIQEKITHTATELRVEHPSEGDDHVLVYRLDGTETPGVLTSHGEELVILTRATWDSGKLLLEQASTSPEGHRFEMKTVWFLDAEGQLVREVTVRVDGQAKAPVAVIARRK